jgi:peptidoglycan/LPS O-acetylase OafA/YrhL
MKEASALSSFQTITQVQPALVAMKTHARPPVYLPFLDGLRALAALFVVMGHLRLQIWPSNIYPQSTPRGVVGQLTGFLAYSHTAVTVFIAISGFCLMMPLARGGGVLKGGYWGFLRRRARRILPPYYAALLFSILADRFLLSPHTNTLYDMCFPLTGADIWQHLFLVQDFGPHQYSINGPLWSIAVEFQIYLLFPMLVMIRRRFGIVWVVTGALAASVAGSWAIVHEGIGERSPQYLFVFALGMLAAHLAFAKAERTAAEVRRLFGWGCLSIAMGGIMGLALHHLLGTNKTVTDFSVGIVMFGVLLLCALRPSNGLPKALSSGALVTLGAFSYSVYLIHMPLQQIFWQYAIAPLKLSPPLSFLFTVVFGTPLVVGVAYGFFRICERPFMTSKISEKWADIAVELSAV